MASCACRWTFTHNNYSEDDVHRAERWITAERCVYGVVGRETAASTGTPHLQGFLQLKNKCRMSSLRKNLFKTAHYEIARGSDEENQKYCTKSGDIVVEVGKPALKIGTKKSCLIANEIAQRIAKGEDLNELLESDGKYLESYYKHMQFVEKVTEMKSRAICFKDFKDNYGSDNLVFWPWQVELYDMLTKEQPDRRKIYWYVDTIGGAGKSSFASMFISRHKAVRFRGSVRMMDVAYAYKREPVVFFDFPRSAFDVEKMCSIMEQFKDGEIFSSKYTSGMKFFASPHVIVFANFWPPKGAFSEDRIIVRLIKNGRILK